MTIHLNVVTTGNNKRVVPQEPTPIRIPVGEELDFVSTHGTVGIHLDPGHGFQANDFHTGGEKLRAVTVGKFVLRCTVHFSDGTEAGWGPGNPNGGGTEVIIVGGGDE